MPPFILNFHGLGTPPRTVDDGEAAVWVGVDVFEACLEIAQAHGAVITFDDSNETDFTIARPALLKRRMTAHFFILTGMIGQPTYMSPAQVRTLAEDGFTIGSHGIDHLNWRTLDDAQLRAETQDSRAALEQLIGRPVRSTGIPFGSYDARVLKAIRAAGYNEAYSSDGGLRLSEGLPTPRLSIRQDTDIAGLAARIRRAGSFTQRARQEVKLRLKGLR